MVSIATLTMMGCGSDVESTAFCDMPAPLQGQYDPMAEGYIFTFHEGVDIEAEVERLSAAYAMEVTAVYDQVLGGFSASMSEETMQQLRCERSIATVEHNASGGVGLAVGVDIQATPARAPSR